MARHSVGAGEGIRTPDLLITNQLLYRPELRQPKQKLNFSTRHATQASPCTLNGLYATQPSFSVARLRTARCPRRPTHSGFERDRASGSTPASRTARAPTCA